MRPKGRALDTPPRESRGQKVQCLNPLPPKLTQRAEGEIRTVVVKELMTRVARPSGLLQVVPPLAKGCSGILFIVQEGQKANWGFLRHTDYL